MNLFPSVDMAKAYADSKGYRYAHLWFNEACACAFFNPFKGSWKNSMDRHEKACLEAVAYGRHIKNAASPIQWGEV